MLNIPTGTISQCHNYLDKMGKINQQSVQSLPPEIKEFLKKVTPARLKELANMNCFAADKVKQELDKKYGENNYIVIAIGRSISSIAELMQELGVDTKIIPLSGLRKGSIEYIPEKLLHTYKAYLVQIGLSKTDLEQNKNKMYVIMDYTHYGNSLEKAEKLLKHNCLLGNAQNLTAISINKVLGDEYKKRNFDTLFDCSRFKDYAYVGKLNINHLDNVFNKCSPDRINDYKGNITQGLRKLFWFNVFNSSQNNDYTNIIPTKELDAINNHYLSLKAIRNYIKREQKTIEQL